MDKKKVKLIQCKSDRITNQMLIVVESKMSQSKEQGLELLHWGIVGVNVSPKWSSSKMLHNLVRSVMEILLLFNILTCTLKDKKIDSKCKLILP